MDQTYVLGIDVGTQGLKAAMYTAEGVRVWVGSASYATRYPRPGVSEQEPRDWWKALVRVLQSCVDSESLAKVSAVTVCATSSTVLVVDAEGEPVSPGMMWMDTRAGVEADAMNAIGDPAVQRVMRYSGGKASAEWMTPKSLWIKNNGWMRPGYKIVEQLDWMNYRLTGRWTASRCNATCKWNYTPEGFSDTFFRAIGFEEYAEWWPTDVLAVGERVGGIVPSAAAETGLKAGVPVFQGGIDAHIGMLGIGATGVGDMSMITGTSFVHLVHTREAVFEPGLWGPYADAILPDSWLLEGGQLTCGSLTSWYVEQFYPGADKSLMDNIYKEILDEARRIEPGSDGLVMMDSWQGNRTPYRNPWMKGTLFGLTMSHTRHHIFRAILESVAYGTNHIIKTFERSGVGIRRVVASGGGVKNELWMQIIADVTGIPIDIAQESEAGTKGCAVIGAYGLGLYGSLREASARMTSVERQYAPDPMRQQAYRDMYETYIQLNERLMPLMEKAIPASKRCEGVAECNLS